MSLWTDVLLSECSAAEEACIFREERGFVTSSISGILKWLFFF